MIMTLPGANTPSAAPTSTRSAPAASPRDPAANEQRFDRSMKDAAPEAAPATSNDQAPAERASSAQDTTDAAQQTGSTPADETTDDRAQADATEQPAPANPDWLMALPAQTPPPAALPAIASALASATGQSDAQASEGTDTATVATVQAGGEPALTPSGTPARWLDQVRHMHTAQQAQQAQQAQAASTAAPAAQPSDTQPLAANTLPSRTDAAAPGGATGNALASGAEQGQTDAQTGSALDATPTPRTAADWQATLGRVQTDAGNRTVTLQPNQPTQWREPMLNALGERVQWQMQRGVDQAVIRLEPPQMGRIDIVIRQDAGGLQVQLNATHREVVQQLHAVSDALRQDLGQRQSLEVNVQVGDPSRREADAQGRRQRQDAEASQDPTRALQDTDASTTPGSFSLHHELG